MCARLAASTMCKVPQVATAISPGTWRSSTYVSRDARSPLCGRRTNYSITMAATPTTKTLWIAKTALMQMRNLANEHTPLETGGALVGYEAENLEVVVTDVIGPGPHAKHRRLRFRPDYDYQQAQLDRHFAQTQGREFYLGTGTHILQAPAP